MSNLNRDPAAIWDMVQAIQEIQQFTAEFSEDSFLETLWVQRVVERDFEILGEAARRVSMDFQREHADVDWRNTIALRNVIAHRYEQVDYEILWDIIQTVLPNLLEALKTLLADLPEPN
ncbi:MAG: HepT-like ribonuclease domain-containing protein [Phormidesmis sp.]